MHARTDTYPTRLAPHRRPVIWPPCGYMTQAALGAAPRCLWPPPSTPDPEPVLSAGVCMEHGPTRPQQLPSGPSSRSLAWPGVPGGSKHLGSSCGHSPPPPPPTLQLGGRRHRQSHEVCPSWTGSGHHPSLGRGLQGGLWACQWLAPPIPVGQTCPQLGAICSPGPSPQQFVVKEARGERRHAQLRGPALREP